MRVFIHTGHLSFDNGAVAPTTQYFNLAKLLDVYPETGAYYGDDSLEVEAEDWPIVEELLREAKMLFRVHQVHSTWQNVRTNVVRRLMRLPEIPELEEAVA